jgi:hypothetical protein
MADQELIDQYVGVIAQYVQKVHHVSSTLHDGRDADNMIGDPALREFSWWAASTKKVFLSYELYTSMRNRAILKMFYGDDIMRVRCQGVKVEQDNNPFLKSKMPSYMHIL